MPTKKKGRGRPRKVPKNDPETEELINFISVDPLDVKIETVFSVEEIENNDSDDPTQMETDCYNKKQIWKMKKENQCLIEENNKLKDLNLDLQYEMKVLKEKLQAKTQLPDPPRDPIIPPVASFSRIRIPSISSEDEDIFREQSDNDSIRSESFDSITEDDESEQEEFDEEMLLEEMPNNSYEKFIEPTISTEGNIILSNENELLLKLHSDEAKDDTKFINQLLLSLYPREDLKNISVTGSAARNGGSKGTHKKCISLDKLAFIYKRMSDRVERSSGTFQEKLERLKQSKVRSCINQKLQYECKRDKMKNKRYFKNKGKSVTSSSISSSLNTEEIPVKTEEIQLTKQREVLLNNISKSSKDDGKFVYCLMLGLYKPEELTRLSVTGRSTNNRKMNQTAKQPICPQKLLYIFSEYFGFSN